MTLNSTHTIIIGMLFVLAPSVIKIVFKYSLPSIASTILVIIGAGGILYSLFKIFTS